MGSISCHIILLVLIDLGQTHTHAYRHLQTEAIIRNQAHAGLWLPRAWFNNGLQMIFKPGIHPPKAGVSLAS